MQVTTDRFGRKVAATGAARQTMCAVAAKLHDHGFEICLPEGENCRRLVIVNAKRARSEITVADDGYVIWDYWPSSGATTDPVDLAGVTLFLLGPASAGVRPVVGRGLTLKGRVGRALREVGLHVTITVYEDDDALDVASEVVATNPGAPFCGLVRMADDARITWECRINGSAAECALAVTDTIGPLLAHGAEGMRHLWLDATTY
jgi:hypothetical protein